MTGLSDDFQRVEQAIRFLEGNFRDQPSLEEIASSVHLSKYHFQRVFKRWAGVTPTQFLQYLTIEYAKERLKESRSILNTALESGLSGPSRLHDLFVTFEAVTPGEFKLAGSGLKLRFGVHASPFGRCLLAMSERGICAMRFMTAGLGREEILGQLRNEWPRASFIESPQATRTVIRKMFADVDDADSRRIHLILKGTNFQVQVWRALLDIPVGAMVSYQDVATHIGSPSATRAVANAIARNPLAYIIPCHRVISKVGSVHRYRWGAARKKAMLGREASQYRSTPAVAQAH
jgi:AraC family transcriptional regulator of adaptative response/methylated-DNA-[protein]-cysteine methyltransferase